MTEELMADWLKVVWGRWPGALLGQNGSSFMVTTSKKIKKLVAEMNTDLVTTYIHILVCNSYIIIEISTEIVLCSHPLVATTEFSLDAKT